MLVLEIKEGKSCPVFVCDVCKEVIPSARQGVAVYKENIGQGELRTFYTVCARECHELMETHFENENNWGGWQPLEYVMHWLCENMKFKPLKRDPYEI